MRNAAPHHGSTQGQITESMAKVFSPVIPSTQKSEVAGHDTANQTSNAAENDFHQQNQESSNKGKTTVGRTSRWTEQEVLELNNLIRDRKEYLAQRSAAENRAEFFDVIAGQLKAMGINRTAGACDVYFQRNCPLKTPWRPENKSNVSNLVTVDEQRHSPGHESNLDLWSDKSASDSDSDLVTRPNRKQSRSSGLPRSPWTMEETDKLIQIIQKKRKTFKYITKKDWEDILDSYKSNGYTRTLPSIQQQWKKHCQKYGELFERKTKKTRANLFESDDDDMPLIRPSTKMQDKDQGPKEMV